MLTRGEIQKLFPSCLTWQVMRNEELTQELLSLAKDSIHPPGSAHQSSPKLGRGRAVGHPRSAHRGKVRDSLPFQQPLGEQGSTRPLLSLSPNQPEDAAASEHEQQELERNVSVWGVCCWILGKQRGD